MLQESCPQPEVTILHLGGGLSSCKRTQRYCYAYSLRRNQHPASRLYPHLTATPPFLHPLPSLISNYLNLTFGTQGRSRRLNEVYILQTRNRGHRKYLNSRAPQSPVQFQFRELGDDSSGHFLLKWGMVLPQIGK